MRVAIIGLGLIGGSIARDLLRTRMAVALTGVDEDASHARQALDLGLVQTVAPLTTAVRDADLILLAVPVDAIVRLLPLVLDSMRDVGAVVDMGSTKRAVVACVQSHPRRPRFVAAHPMAGTEESGPGASMSSLFKGKPAILCDTEASAPDAVATAESLFVQGLGMRLIRMDATRHDLYAAYISHLPHLVSYALTLAALAKADDSQDIFSMAGGGFASMARLSRSSPEMWDPIFRQNGANLLDAIDRFQRQLDTLRAAVAADDTVRIRALIESANRIRDFLPR